MSNPINTIDKLINDLVKLIEETDNNRAYQRFGSLVDELISYVDSTIHDYPLTQDSIDKLNNLELQYGSKKFESFKESLVIDKFIYEQGKLLSDTLTASSRIDEVELISDLIGAYTMLTSYYGDATGRIPESLGVDLNEAAALKLDKTDDSSALSDKFIRGFNESLADIYE